MALVFVNRYFFPDHSATSQMLGDLAFALAEPGRARSVHVVTSRQRYDAPNEQLAARETVGGVHIHRVWTTRFGRRNLVGRTLDYATFYLSAGAMLWRITARGDVVVAKTDPPMMSVVAGPIAWVRGARLVNWLQDVFPEIATATGIGQRGIGRLAFGVMKALRDRSLKSAQMTVAVGDRMADHISRLGVSPPRICVIPNWSDGCLVVPISAQDNRLRHDWDLADAFVIGYSGNLGRAHEFATFIDAIARLEQQAADGRLTIVWLFIGGGALFAQFEAEVTRRGLTSVRFRPYQPRERLAESLSAADVHLVSLRPELEGLVVPSKYYGIAAAGRAAIFVGDAAGEIAMVLRAADTGITVAMGDGAALAAAVGALAADRGRVEGMGRRARALFEREYDRPVPIARWAALLDGLDGTNRDTVESGAADGAIHPSSGR